MKVKGQIIALLAGIASLTFHSIIWAAEDGAIRWEGVYRGVNAPTHLEESDVRDLAAWKANLVRLQFNTTPLMNPEPPYDINQEAVSYLDTFLGWAEKYGIRVVIDPHAMPCTKKNTTTSPNDKLWKDRSCQDQIVKMWEYLAKRYADRGAVIAGYDVVNEPNVPRDARGRPEGGTADWNALAARLVKEIRKYDRNHTIIVETLVSRRENKQRVYPLDGPGLLRPPADSNLVLSPHFYEPGAVSNMGTSRYPETITYPGEISGVRWDKEKLRSIMEPVREMQQRTGLPILIGEFSASRPSGESGVRYLRDLMELFEEYQWSWAFHTFRGSSNWDPEKEAESDRPRSAEAPRAKVLRSFMSKNDCCKQPEE